MNLPVFLFLFSLLLLAVTASYDYKKETNSSRRLYNVGKLVFALVLLTFFLRIVYFEVVG